MDVSSHEWRKQQDPWKKRKGEKKRLPKNRTCPRNDNIICLEQAKLQNL